MTIFIDASPEEIATFLCSLREARDLQPTECIKPMSTTQADIDALTLRLSTHNKAEAAQFRGIVSNLTALIAEAKTQQGQGVALDLSGLEAEIERCKDIVSEEAPVGENKFNVELGFVTKGDEEFTSVLKNKNVSPERAGFLRQVFDSAKAAAETEPDSKDMIPSTFFFTENGKTETFTVASLQKKAIADVAVASIMNEVARKQLDAFRTPPEA